MILEIDIGEGMANIYIPDFVDVPDGLKYGIVGGNRLILSRKASFPTGDRDRWETRNFRIMAITKFA